MPVYTDPGDPEIYIGTLEKYKAMNARYYVLSHGRISGPEIIESNLEFTRSL